MEAERESKTLFIENLPFDCTDSKLSDLFSSVVPVKRCFVVNDRDGRCSGVGYAIFALVSDVQTVLDHYKAEPATMNGRRLRLTVAVKKHFDKARNDAGIESDNSSGHYVHPSEYKAQMLSREIYIAGIPKNISDTDLYYWIRKSVYCYTTFCSEIRDIIVRDYTNDMSTRAKDEHVIQMTRYCILKLQPREAVNPKFYHTTVEVAKEIETASKEEPLLKDSKEITPLSCREWNPFAAKIANSLIIRNISFDTTVKDIVEAFSKKWGPVFSVRLPGRYDHKLRRKNGLGFAFVVTASHEDALRAVADVKVNIRDREAVVDWSENKEKYETRMTSANASNDDTPKKEANDDNSNSTKVEPVELNDDDGSDYSYSEEPSNIASDDENYEDDETDNEDDDNNEFEILDLSNNEPSDNENDENEDMPKGLKKDNGKYDDLGSSLFISNLPKTLTNERTAEVKSSILRSERPQNAENPLIVLCTGMRYELRRLIGILCTGIKNVSIKSINVMNNRQTNKLNGSAFISLSSDEAAKAIYERLVKLNIMKYETDMKYFEENTIAFKNRKDSVLATINSNVREGDVSHDPLMRRALQQKASTSPLSDNKEKKDNNNSEKVQVEDELFQTLKKEGFIIDNRFLAVYDHCIYIRPAMNKKEISDKLEMEATSADRKRNLHLAKVGLMLPGIQGFVPGSLSPNDEAKRATRWANLKKLMEKNINMFFNPQRLTIANLGKTFRETDLAEAIVKAFKIDKRDVVKQYIEERKLMSISDEERKSLYTDNEILRRCLRKAGVTELRLIRVENEKNKAEDFMDRKKYEPWAEKISKNFLLNRGMAYVAFSSPEQTRRALDLLNNRYVNGNPQDHGLIVEYTLENSKKIQMMKTRREDWNRKVHGISSENDSDREKFVKKQQAIQRREKYAKEAQRKLERGKEHTGTKEKKFNLKIKNMKRI